MSGVQVFPVVMGAFAVPQNHRGLARISLGKSVSPDGKNFGKGSIEGLFNARIFIKILRIPQTVFLPIMMVLTTIG